MTEQQPYLGRCRSCEFTIFAAAEDVREADGFDKVKAGLVYRIPERGVFSRCTLNHRVFPLKRIKGTYSKDHKCDVRCLNAKGHECTCSCGGANHGRGHAVTVHEASGIVLRHIGEVGKWVRGTAKVQAKKADEGRPWVLYAFLSQDQTAVIKWFAPLSEDPKLEVGQEVTFRAWVKRHDDHERWGKSTIVEFLKEV